jgi:intracellular multiplication protein IcmP
MSAQGNQGEPAIVLLMLLLLLAVIGWLFWYMTGNFWLDYVFRWMRFGELWPINLFTHHYDACLTWLREAPVGNEAPSSQTVRLTNACFGSAFLNQIPGDKLDAYYRISSSSISAIGAEAIDYYRWPLALVLIGVGIGEIFFSPRNNFLTRHTLESLIRVQAKMWPIISPIVKVNPSKTGRILGDMVPDKLPLFAEALSPEEWISWNRIPLVNGVPDRDAVRRAFIHQLGPRWNGIASLPLHMRALLAAFALKGAQKREESETLLGRLALSWSPATGFKPDHELAAEIEKILRSPECGGRIAPVLDQYAWRTTAMIGALHWARNNGGVLAPAQFLWLRAEDRALWYPLNNLGRRAFHSEGAGAMAHFMAETNAKKPLPIPRVDTAVVTLNTYLHDPDKRTIPIPPREEPGGKN